MWCIIKTIYQRQSENESQQTRNDRRDMLNWEEKLANEFITEQDNYQISRIS